MMRNFGYLMEHFCALWWVPLLVSTFLCGLWFAWSIWSKFGKRYRIALQEKSLLEEELVLLRRELKGGDRVCVEDIPEKSFGVPDAEFEGQGDGVRRGDGSSDATTIFDPDLGSIYVDPPTQIDDLTRLEGVDRSIEGRLNSVGIYRLDQLGELNQRQFDALNERAELGFSWADFGDKLKRAGLRSGIGAVGVDVVSGIEEQTTSEGDGVEEREIGTAGLVLESGSGDSATIDPDLEVGKKLAPIAADELTLLEVGDEDLSARLKGEEEDMGINEVGAIGQGNKELVFTQERELDFLGFEGFEGFEGGDSEEEGKEEPEVQRVDGLGGRGKSRANDADDLTTIEGVDGGIATKLNGLGIFRVKQLQSLDGLQADYIRDRTGWDPKLHGYGARLKWPSKNKKLNGEQGFKIGDSYVGWDFWRCWLCDWGSCWVRCCC